MTALPTARPLQRTRTRQRPTSNSHVMPSALRAAADAMDRVLVQPNRFQTGNGEDAGQHAADTTGAVWKTRCSPAWMLMVNENPLADEGAQGGNELSGFLFRHPVAALGVDLLGDVVGHLAQRAGDLGAAAPAGAAADG